MLGAMTVLAALVSVDPFGDRAGPGANAAVLVLVAFLGSFLAIRTSARLTRGVSWWPGGVQSGGVHLHHLVWGILLMLLCGFLAFALPASPPWWHLVAIGFGVGAGFTLDEFALWVHLEDVYWSDEGRASFDAVVATLAFAALVVIGTRPFGLDDPRSIWGTTTVVVVVVGLAAACFAKGRVMLGVIGLFVPVVAAVGAVRLARPASPWARRRYDAETRRRAQERFALTRPLSRAGRRISDLVAGAPSAEEPGDDPGEVSASARRPKRGTR
jgi:hypothetical protein